MLATVDNALRASLPPFDGLSDAAAWLGLRVPGTNSSPPSIDIRVGPPVDLIPDLCSLSKDMFKLTLHAHPKFDVSQVGLAVRAVPGYALETRKQVSSEIKWSRVKNGRKEGVAEINLQDADNALAMLMIGNSTVRRQWFLDPTKARNSRLLAVQHFDKDLKMIRHAVLDINDSVKFEEGVAALLFLLGFNPCVQIENDSPDIIVTTPSGRLAIVECTMRIADFSLKIGKIVDRRGTLIKSLANSKHHLPVLAVLVCRLPKDQIAAHPDYVRSHNILVITGDDLKAIFDRVRFVNDPDSIYNDALATINSNSNPNLG